MEPITEQYIEAIIYEMSPTNRKDATPTSIRSFVTDKLQQAGRSTDDVNAGGDIAARIITGIQGRTLMEDLQAEHRFQLARRTRDAITRITRTNGTGGHSRKLQYTKRLFTKQTSKGKQPNKYKKPKRKTQKQKRNRRTQ